MITFKTLLLENFLSFESALLNLDNQGLVLVEGKNKCSSCFDSNGAGKSALFEAFLWCLWGQTIRGYRADEVVNRIEGKNCLVTLDFTDSNGVSWKVQRGRKHHIHGNDIILTREGIVWNEAVDVQEKIDSVLGIDFKSFVSAYIFYKNDTKPFSASSDLEQKKLLEKLYDLEKYSGLEQIAKDRVSVITSEVDSVKLKQERIREKREEFEKQKQYNKDQLNKLSKTTEDNIDLYSKKILEFLEREKTIVVGSKVEQLGVIDSEIDLLSNKKYELTEDLKNESDAAREFLTEKKVELGKVEKDINDLTREKNNFEKNLGAFCVTCKQEVPESHKEKHISDLKESLVQRNVQVKEFQKEIVEIAKEINSFQKNIEKVDMEKQKDQKKLRELYQKKDTLIKELSFLEKEKVTIQNEIEKYERYIESEKQKYQKNSYSDTILHIDNELSRCEKEFVELLEKESTINNEVELYQFFVKAFSRSGIPSLLLDSIIPTLNKYAKYYSSILSGGTIDIEFSNQTVLKSKEVREKFEIRVKNVNGSDSYKGDSSGEKRRIDLCVLFALQKTAILRSKSRFNVCWCDEIFDTLDTSGIEQAISLLEGELQMFSSIFVISHNSELNSFFEKHIVVEKVNGQSNIIENE